MDNPDDKEPGLISDEVQISLIEDTPTPQTEEERAMNPTPAPLLTEDYQVEEDQTWQE